ncbi:MAG: hypothetical protein COT00_00890, partial [Candidatus Omnitrophica bacterium CG07_land_8_20_14_0_80_50_8]
TIAVTGTHGKTTTTALIGLILKTAGRDPSVIVGGWVKALGGNACLGKGPEMVIEADESDSSFLKFSPDIAVITNIEEEHMDHFRNLEDIQAAFRGFINRLTPGGEWFGCSEDLRVLGLANERIRNSTLYGFNPASSLVSASDIMECPNLKRAVAFKAWSRGSRLGTIEMKIIGRHNVLNSLAAIGVGLRLHIPFAVIARALGAYEGAGRRFDVKYEDPQFLIVDDYAHHPTEIQKTLAAAKALHKKRIVALFQPHRYSRAEALLGQFGLSFSDADKLVVTDVYAAGENPLPGVTGDKVCRVIKSLGHKDAVFVERARLTEYLRSRIRPGDLVITLGAGDVGQVAGQLSDFLRNPENQHNYPCHPFESIQGKVLLNEPFYKHTSLKVGGPADYWVQPKDAEDLKKTLRICRDHHLKVYILGAGSNVLAPDEGVRGTVLALTSPYFREIRLDKGTLAARAGVPHAIFIQQAIRQGLGGAEFLIGIPGCIGGALAMNAGSHGQSIASLVQSMTVMDYSGFESVIKKEAMSFGYRSSGIRDAIILEGHFSLVSSKREAVQRKLDQYSDYRQVTQDLKYPSAGCMFKNPKESNCSSGKLIEDAGLKGRRIGNAQVSLKHANFIINLGGASSRDITDLIEEVKKTVKQKFQVTLETEVKIL